MNRVDDQPMNCDIAQNRLAAHDGEHLPEDLAGHVKACALCQRYQARLVELHQQLAALPAPDSTATRLAFLDALTAAGPVIKSIPTLPSQSGSGTAWRSVARSLTWRPIAAGLAATVVVGVILWQGQRGETVAEPDIAVGPRHELLKNVVAYNAQLSQADTPQERIPVLTDMALAITEEARGVYKAARTQEDVRSLAGMFDKVVRDGIVAQAGKFPRFAPPGERQQVLTRAADQLAVAASDARMMAGTAPPQVKEALEAMAVSAQTGQVTLRKLALGEGT
jgi:hypothetical protein